MKLTPIFPIFVLSLAPIAPAVAQLAPDNSLGAESSVVTPVNQTTDRIDGGAARGSNLFHSFGSFNVDAGRSVYFANPPAIENILTRVTGGNPSNIMGTLGVLGDANLFLINPNGILFGRDARLDISGSFFATTGDGIGLGKNGRFSTTDLDPSELLHVRPEALFQNALANHMARLNNRGNLAVGSGSALVLHGGQVRNSGSLTAPGGTVMVLGKRIGLLDDASIDVSSSTGGGNVFIGGFLGGRGNIPTAGRTYIGPNVSIWADADNTGDGGNVIVWADRVTGFYGDISARGGPYGGDGGFVEVSGARRLIFRGEVDTTAALGKAGTLLLDPRNIIIADGQPSMEISDAQTVPSDLFNGAVGDPEDVTIYESQLEGLSGNTNVVLQATNDIVVEDLSDNSMNWAPGTGDITFIADADGDGAGDFSMADPADTINTNGRNIAITGASLTLGNIDTSLPAPDGAGELLSTAAVVSTEPGEPLNSISGNLFGGSDVDLYEIYLTGEGTFSATTIDGSNVNTQLFLFDADGLGLYGNNDNREACNCRQSTLPAGDSLTPTAPGIYYLGINVSGVNPVSGDGDIFPGNFDRVLEPTGAGSALPLVGWENVRGDDLGDYTIALTGVEAASATFAEEIGNTQISNSGAITLRATNGNITAVDLNGASFSGAGGEIRLDAAGDIVLNGRVDASGVVGGGSITLNSGGNINLNSSFLTSSTNGVSDAGSVTIIARDTVRFNGGGASSQVNSNGSGSAGGIEITTGSLELMDGARLNARTFGIGDAGTIKIEATQRVLFRGEDSLGNFSGAFSEVERSAEGNGGGIEITTGSLEVLNGALLSASTFGKGNAGTLSIAATQRVLFAGEDSLGFPSGAQTSVSPSAEGNGGGMQITTGSLELMDGARLSASTFGKGNAGTLSIVATQRVLLRGKSSRGIGTGAFSQVDRSAEGNAGGIEITTGSLELLEGAQLGTSTFGKGDAGTLSIVATQRVLLRGENSLEGFVSGAFSQVEESAEGNAEGIEITTGQLLLGDGALVQASTRGKGKAGTITVNAGVVDIAGSDSRGLPSGLFTSTNTEFDAGDITVNSNVFQIAAGGVLSARSRGDGTGGTIAVNTHQFSASSGGQLVTTTFGDGVAGNIEVNASGEVSLSGSDPTYSERIADIAELDDSDIAKFDIVNDISETSASTGLYASSTQSSTQGGGTIALRAESLRVGDGARIRANSDGTSSGGNISINADKLQLEDGSNINTDTASGLGGGNITLTAQDLRVRDNSKIETNAGGRGDGGDITINTDTLVVLEGSAITANAVEGRGGNIAITTSGLFSSPDSDITASSQFGVDGIVAINIPDSNPTAGLVFGASSPIDAYSLISKGCEEYRGSEFIITGRGGIPPHPFETLPGEVIWLDWRALTDDNFSLGYSVPSEKYPVSEVGTPQEGELPDDEIRQAQGWLQLPDGTVVLTAYPVKMTPVGPVMQHPGCQIILGDSEQ